MLKDNFVHYPKIIFSPRSFSSRKSDGILLDKDVDYFYIADRAYTFCKRKTGFLTKEELRKFSCKISDVNCEKCLTQMSCDHEFDITKYEINHTCKKCGFIGFFTSHEHNYLEKEISSIVRDKRAFVAKVLFTLYRVKYN